MAVHQHVKTIYKWSLTLLVLGFYENTRTGGGGGGGGTRPEAL